MSQPYIGEIRIFAGNFAPAGWAFCDGQVVPISENETLFNLIGMTYGGDGVSTFALPDLQTGGVEQVQLSANQIPSHTHAMTAVDQAGNQTSPSGNLPAQSFDVVPYINDVPGGTFNATAVSAVGGSQPHTNLQPYLCVDFIISLFGVFPSQT
jgi:microcystin-dependent protein